MRNYKCDPLMMGQRLKDLRRNAKSPAVRNYLTAIFVEILEKVLVVLRILKLKN